MTPTPNPTAEQIARRFHEAYERLAPDYGYKTREASAVTWEEVPETNRQLMIATVSEVMSGLLSEGAPSEHTHAWDPESTPPRKTCACDEKPAPTEEQIARVRRMLRPFGLGDACTDRDLRQAFTVASVAQQGATGFGETADLPTGSLESGSVAPQENPKCEHGVELSDLCQFVDHVANAPQESSEEPAPSPARDFGKSATVAASPKGDKAREKLIAEAREFIPAWSDGQIKNLFDRLADALAAQPVLDPENVLRVTQDAIETYLREDLPEDGLTESETIAHALCEAAKRGELSA